jgi:ketosteroid isomerase-like protein
VVVEALWTGTVGTAAGPFAEGTNIRARFAMFFELRDGKITAQRNYDCFDPW